MKETAKERASRVALQKTAAVLYFGLSSALTQYANKALFTIHGYNYPLVVAMLQTVFMLPFCLIAGRPTLSFKTLMDVAPLSLVNLVNIVAGLTGTGGLSVPMFIALRRFTIVFTVVIEIFYLKKVYDSPTLASIFFMIAGSLVAALTDLSFNLVGYAAVMTNNLFSSLYLLIIKNNKAAKSLTSTQLLFFSAVWNLPAMVFLAFWSGQVDAAKLYPNFEDRYFQATLVLSCVLGLLINHATFVCARVTTPLTVSVTGSLKNVVMTIVGAFAFGDYKYNMYNALGLTISMFGGIWYATIGALRKAPASDSASDGHRDDGEGKGLDTVINASGKTPPAIPSSKMIRPSLAGILPPPT